MSVNDVWTLLGRGAVIVTATGTVVWWLARKLIESRFSKVEIELKADADRELARLKNSLQADTDRELERLRNSLQKTALEHQVRFSRLHEERAKVIADLYSRLVDEEARGSEFVDRWTPGRGDDKGELDKEYFEYRKKHIELLYFVKTHRIYLPEQICSRLEDFLDATRAATRHVHVYSGLESSNPDARLQRVEELRKAIEAFTGKIPAVRRALEEAFRKILGVESSHA